MARRYTVEKEVVQKYIDIPEEEIAEYRAAFDMFDKDHSGSISSKEFLKVLKNLGQNVTKEEAENILKDLDQDGSGEIEFEEFISYMRKIKIQEELNEEDVVIKAFQSFDGNKDDVITVMEFREILCKVGQDRFTDDEVDEIFKEAELMNDGQLNYREFVQSLRGK